MALTGSLTDARQVLDDYDQLAPERLRLFPADPADQADARRLFDRFFDHPAVAVRAWASAYMVFVRTSTTRIWSVSGR